LTIGFVLDPLHRQHDLPGHPESAIRLDAIQRGLQDSGMIETMDHIEATDATSQDVLRVHSSRHLLELWQLAGRGRGEVDPDTYVVAGSPAAAFRAAGGTISATKAVLDARVQRAFAFVRPPGHHATPDISMGFCLLNNIAIASAWALQTDTVERLSIVDIDVHHGNGTQEAFADTSNVQFISLHEHPLYPYTGDLCNPYGRTGLQQCINVPLPAGTGDSGYRRVMERIVAPALTAFRPDLMMVSLGYDAHWADPLAFMALSLTGYAETLRALAALADRLCQGRMVLVLEGGYKPEVLQGGTVAALRAVSDGDTYDPLGPPGESETDVAQLIDRVVEHHNLA